MSFANGVVATFDCGLEPPERARLEVLKGHTEATLSNPWLAGESPVEPRRDDVWSGSRSRRRTLTAGARGLRTCSARRERAADRTGRGGRSGAPSRRCFASAAGNEPVEANCLVSGARS
jgi:hypothetical protein